MYRSIQSKVERRIVISQLFQYISVIVKNAIDFVKRNVLKINVF